MKQISVSLARLAFRVAELFIVVFGLLLLLLR